MSRLTIIVATKTDLSMHTHLKLLPSSFNLEAEKARPLSEKKSQMSFSNSASQRIKTKVFWSLS
jgi:hypothetical protein